MNGDDAIAAYNAEYARLRDAAHGRDVVEVEHLLRDWARTYKPHLREIDLVFLARVMSDEHWVRKHPLSAIALAWRHRDSRRPHRSLLWLWKPRFSG
jgi:hypothetical protein